MEVFHVIKIHKPPEPHMSWLIYDKVRSRVERRSTEELPAHVPILMQEDSIAFFSAQWDNEKDRWFIHGKTHRRQW